MSFLKERSRTRLSEQIADKIEFLKDLTAGLSGCTSIQAEDIKNDCWLRQIAVIESFIREVPETIASMVDSLINTSASDRKCLRSWRKHILNQFKAMANALKDKIDATMLHVNAISDGSEEEECIDSEVKHELEAIRSTEVNSIDASPIYDSSLDDDRPVCKTDKIAQFTCRDCLVIMTSLRALHRHRRLVHCQLKPHKCDRCPLTFKHPSALQRHQLSPHTRDVRQQQYLCDLCPQVCANKNIFQVHRRTHTGENSFVCDICSRSLGTKNGIVTHMRTHTNERPYECPLCSKTFRQKSGFRNHLHRHNGHRPHKCNWCVKSFLTKCLLSTHILSHTGERPHECPICKRSYKIRYRCKKHIQTAHREFDVDAVFPNLPKRSNKITAE